MIYIYNQKNRWDGHFHLPEVSVLTSDNGYRYIPVLFGGGHVPCSKLRTGEFFRYGQSWGWAGASRAGLTGDKV